MAIEVISKERGKTKLKCAFCHGEGIDPFGVLSELSLCPVCAGRKVVEMHEPLRECAFCQGTGAYPGTRLTCTACMGKGVVSVKEPVVECPECRGTGVAHYRVARAKSRLNLPCVVCSGKGVITSDKKG
jgi:DnaJ-class molecular chaperone